MDFLLDAADDTMKELRGTLGDRRRRGGRPGVDAVDPFEDVSDDDIRAVVDELTRARLAAEAGRDDETSAMWMPREPILAIVQTELTRQILRGPAKLVEDTAGIGASVRIADDPGVIDRDGRRAFGRFEVTRPKILSDPRWLWAGVVIAWNKFKAKAAFGGLPFEAVPIAEKARIVLVGDWGSGLPRAQDVSKNIRIDLDQGIAEGREQHVVHLGDVYYTGSQDEYAEHFLAPWPVRRDEPIGSYTICGNHDMYRGGHDFYGTALADPRFVRQAGKSVFALRNDDWQFLGLDTSYVDQQLSNGQAEWVERQLEMAPRVRTTLFSHHQLFSCYEDVGEHLRGQLAGVLESGRIDAWFWGHEHRCLTYEPQHGVGFASCVGHGGVPEYLIAGEGEPYPDGLRYDFRLRHGKSIEPWNTFGFAVIDLDGPSMVVRYIDERGREHHREDV